MVPAACSRSIVCVLIRSVLKSNIQSPAMPRTTKNSAHWNNILSQEETEVQSSQEDISTSDQEPDPEVSFHPYGTASNSKHVHATHRES